MRQPAILSHTAIHSFLKLERVIAHNDEESLCQCGSHIGNAAHCQTMSEPFPCLMTSGSSPVQSTTVDGNNSPRPASTTMSTVEA